MDKITVECTSVRLSQNHIHFTLRVFISQREGKPCRKEHRDRRHHKDEGKNCPDDSVFPHHSRGRRKRQDRSRKIGQRNFFLLSHDGKNRAVKTIKGKKNTARHNQEELCAKRRQIGCIQPGEYRNSQNPCSQKNRCRNQCKCSADAAKIAKKLFSSPILPGRRHQAGPRRRHRAGREPVSRREAEGGPGSDGAGRPPCRRHL